MKIVKLIVITIINCILLFHVALAQSDKKATSVGVVLSGGGAHGWAHVGVLSMLDSLGIKPTYIAGTSAGSMAGAFYALGYPPEQMREIAQKQDWEKLLSNYIDLNFVSMEEKEDFNRYMLELPFDFNGIYLPSGVIEGENIYDFFARYFLPAVNIDSFKNLPIPYMVNATNLETGASKVFESGYLPMRVRGSMSVPTFFSPVHMEDDSLYTDGGTVHNYMARDLLTKKQDVNIGSYTGFVSIDRKSLDNAFNVLKQSATYQSLYDSRSQFHLADITLFPNTSHLSVFGFSDFDEFIKAGKITVRNRLPEFNKLIIHKKIDTVKAVRPYVKLIDSITIGCITHNHLYRTQSSFVWAKMGLKENKKISFNQFLDGMKRLRGSRYYRSVYYIIQPSKTDINDVKLILRENRFGVVRFSPHYNNVTGVGLALSTVNRNLLGFNSRLFLGIDVAEYPRLKLNYIKYITRKQQNMLGIYTVAERNKLVFYDKNILRKVYKEDKLNYEIRWQYDVNSNLAFGTGFNQSKYIYRPSFVSARDLFKRISYSETFQRAFVQMNSIDKVYFPTKGYIIDAEMKFVLNNQSNTIYNGDTVNVPDNVFNKPFKIRNYVKFNVNIERYDKLFLKNLTLHYGIATGGFFSREINPFDAFWIGGIERLNSKNIPFFGYDYSQVLAYNYVMAKMNFQYKIDKNLYALVRTNISVLDNLPRSYYKSFNNVQYDVENDNLHLVGGWAVGFGYMSRIGPISGYVSANSEYSNILFNISVGHTF